MSFFKVLSPLAVLSVAIFLFVQLCILPQEIVAKTNSSQPLTLQNSGSSNSTNSGSSGTYSVPNQDQTDPSSGDSPTPAVTSSDSSGETSNWSGYAATSGTYTSVSGTWTVPSVSGSGETSADAAWIGIGGITTDDLIQVGTQNLVTADGQVTPSVFYELLPSASQPIDSIDISAGDTITASITETSSEQWTIYIKDETNGESFSTSVTYDSSNSSAEWIEEDPSDGLSQIPLDSFGTVSFSAGSTTDNGTNESISASGAQSLTMVNDESEPLATTSSLGSNGSSFTVTRTSADSGSGIPEFNQDPGSWIRRGMGVGGFGNSSYGSAFPF